MSESQNKNLQLLLSMGYDHDDAKEALARSNNDAGVAIEILSGDHDG